MVAGHPAPAAGIPIERTVELRVVIAGAGEVGYHVTGSLYREGVEIAAIDSDPGVLERLRQEFNITTFLGTATDTETLTQAEVGRADLFLAITNYDETNIIACLMAAEAGAAKRIARVKSIVFGEGSSVSDRTYLGIDLIINPYEVAAEHLANLVTHPQVTDFNQFLDDRVLLVRFSIHKDSPLAGATVLEFGQDSRIPNMVSPRRVGSVGLPWSPVFDQWTIIKRRPCTYSGLSQARSMKTFERSHKVRWVHSCSGTRVRSDRSNATQGPPGRQPTPRQRWKSTAQDR